jgi:hypothetical protein
MAKSQYIADSAPLPQPLLPPNGNQMGAFKTAYPPTSFLKDTLPLTTTFVVTGMSTHIGETADLARRLSEHVFVHRQAGQSGIPTLTSID